MQSNTNCDAGVTSHYHSSCHHSSASRSTHQNLDELDFERGIWKAALDGDLRRASMLLQKDSDCANKLDRSGYSALHYAARAGHIAMCQLLLDNGADINAKLRNGDTPLHRAAYAGHVNVVELLITSGAESLPGDENKTPLHKAVEQKKVVVAEILLRHFPDSLKKEDRAQQTIFHKVKQYNDEDVWLKLFSKYDMT